MGSLNPLWFLGKWRWFAVAALALALSIQTARIDHAKHDLTAARAALKDPATKRTWQSLATQARDDLSTCHGNVGRLDAGLKAQTDALAVMKSDSDRRGQMLADALYSARKTAAEAQSKADRLARFTPKGADVCARMLEIDREASR